MKQAKERDETKAETMKQGKHETRHAVLANKKEWDESKIPRAGQLSARQRLVIINNHILNESSLEY